MRTDNPRLLRRLTTRSQRFLAIESATGLLLLAATAAALVLVNSPLGQPFEHLLNTEIGIRFGTVELSETLHEWINEGLMTIFFFVAGLEIKREISDGELSDPRKALLPVIAAAGGMALPAIIYWLFNPPATQVGWAIPMATDVAFALGIVALVGSRVPPAVKIFLLSLAIADDVGSIAVVALFYSSGLEVGWIAAAALGLGLVLYLRANDVRSIPVYVLVGAFVWVATLESGIPPTLVGVAMGLLAPAHHHVADGEGPPVTTRILEWLHPYSNFLILPVFAIANAGVVITAEMFSGALDSTVFVGIVVARTIGKAVGIFLAVYIAVKIGVARLPSGASWTHITGVAVAAGAGFTVPLFITELAFGASASADYAKLGILIGTAIAGIAGYLILRRSPVQHIADVTDHDARQGDGSSQLLTAGR